MNTATVKTVGKGVAVTVISLFVWEAVVRPFASRQGWL